MNEELRRIVSNELRSIIKVLNEDNCSLEVFNRLVTLLDLVEGE